MAPKPDAYSGDRDAFEQEKRNMLNSQDTNTQNPEDRVDNDNPPDGDHPVIEEPPENLVTADDITAALSKPDSDEPHKPAADKPKKDEHQPPDGGTELKPFKLMSADEPKPKDDGKPEDFTDYDLVYNGEKITKRFNKEGLTAELQKAHHFDTKMKQITPHVNLTNAIIHNPQLATIVNEFLRTGKITVPDAIANRPAAGQGDTPKEFKLKSINEYGEDTENGADKWLQDNLTNFEEAFKAKWGISPNAQPPNPEMHPGNMPNVQPNANATGGLNETQKRTFDNTMMALQLHDSKNFKNVLPIVGQAIKQLNQGQMLQIENEVANGDYTNVIALYDHCAEFYNNQQNRNTPGGGNDANTNTNAPSVKRTFRTKSSGPNPPAGNEPGKLRNAWDYTPKEFNKIIGNVMSS